MEIGRQNGWQQCPKCHLTVERSEGCNHMRFVSYALTPVHSTKLIVFICSCPSCETQFCYNCGRVKGTCSCGLFQRDRQTAHIAQPMRQLPRDNPPTTRPVQRFGGPQPAERPASFNHLPNARLSSVRQAGSARLPCEHQDWDLNSAIPLCEGPCNNLLPESLWVCRACRVRLCEYCRWLRAGDHM